MAPSKRGDQSTFVLLINNVRNRFSCSNYTLFYKWGKKGESCSSYQFRTISSYKDSNTAVVCISFRCLTRLLGISSHWDN